LVLRGYYRGIDAVGIRVEGSAWSVSGYDVNVDALYFIRSGEIGIFVTLGVQMGGGGGAGATTGLLFSTNMPQRSTYGGPTYTSVGLDAPTPLGINIEGDQSFSMPSPNGTIPSTIYLGGGPVQFEAGQYTGVGYTIDFVGALYNLVGK